MKKVALSLLALALIGAGAFAQDAAAPALKIGGYLDIGTNTVSGADSGAKTVVKGDDSGIGWGSYEFRLKYGTSNAGVVLNTRLENLSGAFSQVNATTYAGTRLNTQDAFAWFLVPNLEMIKVQAGQYTNTGTAWNAVDDKGDKATTGQGVAIQITPADGFTFGGGFAPNGSTADASVQGTKAPTYSAGATYTVPGTVLIQGAFYTADKAYVAAVDGGYVGGKLLMDGPLSVKGDFNIYALSKSGSVSYTITDVTVGYALTDALSAGLLTYVYSYGSDTKSNGDSANISFKVNPSISYTVDPVTSVGFGGTYYQGNGQGFITNDANGGAADNKLSGIEINPNATFTIDPQTKVYVNYLYDAWSGDNKPKTDATYSTFKVDFRYTF